MTLAVILVVVLLVAAFAAAAGAFNGPRRVHRRVVVEQPAREVVVERAVPTEPVVSERIVERERRL
jgi:hypothetical protein